MFTLRWFISLYFYIAVLGQTVLTKISKDKQLNDFDTIEKHEADKTRSIISESYTTILVLI